MSRLTGCSQASKPELRASEELVRSSYRSCRLSHRRPSVLTGEQGLHRSPCSKCGLGAWVLCSSCAAISPFTHTRRQHGALLVADRPSLPLRTTAKQLWCPCSSVGAETSTRRSALAVATAIGEERAALCGQGSEAEAYVGSFERGCRRGDGARSNSLSVR